MGWETRGNSQNRYYTRSRKRFGKVEREYVGSGYVAILAAEMDDRRRHDIAVARRRQHEEKTRRLQCIQEWREWMRRLCSFENTVLTRMGFHFHHGQLRFKRMAQLQSNPVWNLIRRANSGDELAMCELEHELQGPNREPILAQVGNLSNQCELAALSAFGDDQKAMTTIVREQMNELRRDLAPTNAIESMIVERIVQCWLQLHLTEMHALHMETPSKELETRIDALNRRYLQSLRTLSIVRKGITKVIKQVSTTIISD